MTQNGMGDDYELQFFSYQEAKLGTQEVADSIIMTGGDREKQRILFVPIYFEIEYLYICRARV